MLLVHITPPSITMKQEALLTVLLAAAYPGASLALATPRTLKLAKLECQRMPACRLYSSLNGMNSVQCSASYKSFQPR